MEAMRKVKLCRSPHRAVPPFSLSPHTHTLTHSQVAVAPVGAGCMRGVVAAVASGGGSAGCLWRLCGLRTALSCLRVCREVAGMQRLCVSRLSGCSAHVPAACRVECFFFVLLLCSGTDVDPCARSPVIRLLGALCAEVKSGGKHSGCRGCLSRYFSASFCVFDDIVWVCFGAGILRRKPRHHQEAAGHD